MGDDIFDEQDEALWNEESERHWIDDREDNYDWASPQDMGAK